MINLRAKRLTRCIHTGITDLVQILRMFCTGLVILITAKKRLKFLCLFGASLESFTLTICIKYTHKASIVRWHRMTTLNNKKQTCDSTRLPYLLNKTQCVRKWETYTMIDFSQDKAY